MFRCVTGTIRITCTVSALVLLVHPPPVSAADSCAQSQTNEAQARALVQADTTAISRLGFSTNASALDDWAKMTADQKNKLYQTAVLNLIQAAAQAPFVKFTAGNASLPNGIASLGPGQAGALINSLRSYGIDNPVLFNLISGAATVSGKPAAAKLGRDILDYSITLLQTGIAVHGGEAVGAAASVAQLGLSLMGDAYAPYALALGAGSDSMTLVGSGIVAWNASGQISHLTELNEADLSRLKTLNVGLQRDVQALQTAKGQLATCQAAPKPASTPSCGKTTAACYKGCSFPQLSTGGAVTPQSDFDAVRAYSRCMNSCEKANDACLANAK